MLSLGVYIIRSLIIILATWLVTNLIGKKSMAQFTPYDLAVLFIISNVVSQPLVNKDSFKTALGAIILSISIVIIGKLSLNRNLYRLNFSPSILIANGKIDREELKKNNINLYTLLSMLRIQGYFKIADVNYAILEVGGDISVIPKSNVRPATTKELNLTPPENGLTYSVIVDGQINKQILTYAQISEEWLVSQLQLLFTAKPEDVFYAEVDSDKQLFANLYSDCPPKIAQ